MDKALGSTDVDEIYETEIEPIKNMLRVKYVKDKSLLLDMRIMAETLFRIFHIPNVTGLKISIEWSIHASLIPYVCQKSALGVNRLAAMTGVT